MSHNCTGPGCPGCYAELNLPVLYPARARDEEYEKYLEEEHEKWERGEG